MTIRVPTTTVLQLLAPVFGGTALASMYTWFISCNLVSGGINLLKFSSNFLNELFSNNFPSELFPASLSPAMARPVRRVSSVAAPEWREVVKHIPRSPCKSIFTHSTTSHNYKVPMGCDCCLSLECSVLRRIQSSLEFISRALLLTPWKIYYLGQKISTKISVIFKINYLENF